MRDFDYTCLVAKTWNLRSIEIPKAWVFKPGRAATQILSFSLHEAQFFPTYPYARKISFSLLIPTLDKYYPTKYLHKCRQMYWGTGFGTFESYKNREKVIFFTFFGPEICPKNHQLQVF